MQPGSTLRQIAAELARGDYSAKELADVTLRRARRANRSLNCFITLGEEHSMAAATTADRRLQGGDASPLTGIPIAHKDIFCIDGWRTTCGSKMLERFVAPYTATAIDRLLALGSVPIAKTNMDEFAMGSSTETSYFGATANPWDRDRTPGGSSGGSAACVAARLCAAATGSDTGGSIRQPAAFCGVTGLKPTYGRVSRYGMIAFASSLDQGGVLAVDVEDAALVLAGMSGFDARDSTSSDHRDPWLSAVPEAGVGGFEADTGLPVIGLVEELFDQVTVGGEEIEAARRVLEGAGFRCKPVSLPNLRAALPAYYVIAGAEASTNLSRYDGVRFGHRCDSPASLRDLYERSRSEGFGTEVKRRILTGAYALSAGYFDAYYLKAQKVRRLVAADFTAAFATADLLLAPATPGLAFPLKTLDDDPVAMYRQDVCTIPISLAGLPALSLPCGFCRGLPVGMQLIANHFEEKTLLRTGAAFQAATDWHRRQPPAIGESDQS